MDKNAPAPQVTVITVTLNCENELPVTFKSVLAQSHKNIEYIVVDGVSSDNTPNIIAHHLPHITHYVSEKDAGIYDAMNKGIRLSSPESKYIIFMNAGDTFYNDRVIEDALNTPGIDGYHIYGNIAENGKVILTPKSLNTYIIATNMVCHQAIFFKTDIIRSVMYDCAFKICADYKLLVELLQMGERFRKLDVTVANYHSHGISRVRRAELHAEKAAIRSQYPRLFALNKLKNAIATAGKMVANSQARK